jgi:hypothetical protein
MQRPVILDKAVEAYGSYTNLAKRLKISITTVHGWARRSKLPDWRAKQIAVVAKRDGVDVFGEKVAAPNGKAVKKKKKAKAKAKAKRRARVN